MPQKPAAAAPMIGVNPNGGGLMATNFEGLFRMSQVFAASGLMPKGMERPETVFVALEMGMEVGLQPMQAVQNIAVINGRPSIWGDALLALVAGSGLLEDFQEFEEGTFKEDDFKAVCVASRAGRSAPIRSEFSIADAKLAGLWTKSGPWTQYPRRMLKMRARSWALRDGFPDVLKGMRSAEEIMDMEPLEISAGPVNAEPSFEPAPALSHEELFEKLMEALPENDANITRESVGAFVAACAEGNGNCEPAKVIRDALKSPENTMAFYTAFGDWVMARALEKGKSAKETAPDKPENKTKGKKSAPAKKAGEKPKDEPEEETRDANVPADALQIDSIKNLVEKLDLSTDFKMDVKTIMNAILTHEDGGLTFETAAKIVKDLAGKPANTSSVDKAVRVVLG